MFCIITLIKVFGLLLQYLLELNDTNLISYLIRLSVNTYQAFPLYINNDISNRFKIPLCESTKQVAPDIQNIKLFVYVDSQMQIIDKEDNVNENKI